MLVHMVNMYTRRSGVHSIDPGPRFDSMKGRTEILKDPHPHLHVQVLADRNCAENL